MQAQQIVRRVRENVLKYGRRAALHDLECRIVNRVTHLEILKGMVVELPDVRDPELFDAPGFEARFVDEADLERYAHAGTHDFTLQFVDEALGRGDRCYALFDGDVLASYGWYSLLPTPIDEHFVLHFDPTYTYMYKGYTIPAYRGKRLHAVGMCRALQAFTEEGKRGLISYVLSTNFASLRSTERMGYRIFGDIYLVRARGHSLAFATRGCRPYGFRAETTTARAALPASQPSLSAAHRPGASPSERWMTENDRRTRDA